MKNITHIIYDKDDGKKLYLYDAKLHNVYSLNGEYYTHMGVRFTKMCLAGESQVYHFKKVNVSLENK